MVGLCEDPEGQTKTAAGIIRTTQGKIVQYVGTKFGDDIDKELQNWTTVLIPPLSCSEISTPWQTRRPIMVHTQQTNVKAAYKE